MPYDPQAWGAIVATHEGAEVFHSAEWLDFLGTSQGAEPVVATVRVDGHPVGHFVGAIVQRLGLRILGSPLRGWATESMGFLLEPGVDRRAVAEALVPFAFHELGCLHVELSDRLLTSAQLTGSRFHQELGQTYRLDLRPPEEEVLSGIRRTTRQEIRKAIRAGLRAEVATDDQFADEFFGYLTAIFARQGLAPTYGVERVRRLIRTLQPSGQLLLLRVLAPDGKTIGTGISVGRNRTAYAWGMAFDRRDEQHHAIELLWWETIRYWKSRGALMFDFGGGGEYKAKYGGDRFETAHLHRSRWAVLQIGRSTVRQLVRLTQVAGARRRR
jgi:CelD/BcsL family acetyltransferase involved in cellulose biosynthesis